MNFLLKKEPNPRPCWSRSWTRDKSSRAARSAVFRENIQKMVDARTHSTDSSVSGEESHSTILLAHIFWF